jgi:3-deoxy-manno-octulosonate cytidylyltransferase (CMP-KDO synthetase)
MILGLIPARLQSERLPRKPLLEIDGLPMVIHILKRAQLAKKLNRVIVCTDSDEIADVVKSYKGEVIKTRSDHINGTERIAEVARKIKCDQVVDIQCDDVFVDPSHIDRLVNFHKKNNNFDIIVPYSKLIKKTDKSIVKIISNKFNKVLYMSRENIPFSYIKKKIVYQKHLDIISFNKKALIEFSRLSKSYNESFEGIELLRALDNNYNLGTFLINTNCFSVNTHDDYINAIKKMKFCKIKKKYK